ncbi:MAG: TonB-dependent receptor [Bacteroidota bacterium]
MIKYKYFNYILFVLLFFAFNQITAQDLNKKITLKAKNQKLGDLLKQISSISQINFSYSAQSIPVDKVVSIKANKKSVKDILDELLIKNGVEYKLVEGQIILKLQKKAVIADKPVEAKSESKTKYTISGFLKDKTTGELLIGATVYAKGTTYGATCNTYGFYSLTLPEGKWDIVFSIMGFNSTNQEIELNSNKKIDIELVTSNISMQEVIVKVKSSEEDLIVNNQLSFSKLSVKTISQMPSFTGSIDLVKSLQAVPGIKSYGDGSSLFYVRGGNSDQNLILVDETPIYNPAHLFGFFSAIAPDAIKDVEVYKGDFPANFGGRLSSVLDIKVKDGNLKRISFSGSLSPFTSSLTLEGPLKKDKSSFFITRRKSNLNWMQFADQKSRPINVEFSDINAKVNVRINSNNRLFVSFYSGRDIFDIKQGALVSGINWFNTLGSIRWNHVFNSKLFSNTTISGSRYDYYLYLSKTKNDYWNSAIQNSSVKTDFSYFPNVLNTIKAGFEVSTHYSNPGNLNLSDVNSRKYVPEISKYNSIQYVIYGSNEQVVNEKITVRYGLRIPVWQNKGEATIYSFNNDYSVKDTNFYAKNQGYSTHIGVEPRINAKYAISNTSSLKVSYNRTTQFVQLLSNSTSPFTSLEVWIPCGPNIKPQVLNQFALGYFSRISKKEVYFSSELFYKHFSNQIDYQDHASMLFNPLIEGELRFGTANAYGLELALKKTAGRVTGWLSYTYSRVFRTIEGLNNNKKYSAPYDRPHDFSINLTYNRKKHWEYTLNWVFLTGSAYSIPSGFYYYNGYSVPYYESKNNGRLPDYHRMDLSIAYHLNKPERRYQHSFVFTLYNAYGRANPFALNFNKIMTDDGKFVVPSDMEGNYNLVSTKISLMGTIPSITYNFKF